MTEVDPILLRLEQLISDSRLAQLAQLLATDRSDRIARLAMSLRGLRPARVPPRRRSHDERHYSTDCR